MTEKRFIGSSGGVYDQYKSDRFIWSVEWEEILQIMNNLNEKARERSKALSKLQKENEQLKQSYKEFEDECQSTFNAMNRKQNDLYRKNFKLKEENEQLKKLLLQFYTEDEINAEMI